MGDTKNFIEMNGKRYDALTGRVIKSMHSDDSIKTVDGFVRRKPSHKHHQAGHAKKADAVHKRTEHSKTLMRTAVKKPADSQKKTTLSTHHTAAVHIDQSTTPQIDMRRLTRAKKIAKSSFISRFGSKTQTTEIHHTTDNTTVSESKNINHPKPVSHTQSASKKSLQQTIHKAVANATSHQQPLHKPEKKRRSLAHRLHISQRAMNVSLFVVAFVAIGGFIAYQNVPNLSMRLAVAKSGVNGNLPGYKPSGFSMNGPIFYQPGQITVSFKSNSDERKFNIVQKNSAWNNEALLENFVANTGKGYQTFQEAGKTIFIYDGSNASWVDDGVWYEIQGTSVLSQDQLIKLANSL